MYCVMRASRRYDVVADLDIYTIYLQGYDVPSSTVDSREVLGISM